jgi:hypothetical protein
METQCDSAILLLDIYPKGVKLVSQREICTLMFIAALTKIAKIWNPPTCSQVDE